MYKEKFNLGGSRAVVTGGGRGIGLATAEALAEHGAGVVICDIDGDELEAGRAALAAKGYRAETRRLDITNSAEVERVAAELNAAGAGRHSRRQCRHRHAGQAGRGDAGRRTGCA